ncbi:hypothetical protein [Flavobacterium sp.]|uniref:hypothetical protein n=1 Tax=Flavobacterium sp. TaxID=239 RepID=UPI00258BBEC1|nr:hypothetical protein [Flavobacterium sp.]
MKKLCYAILFLSFFISCKENNKDLNQDTFESEISFNQIQTDKVFLEDIKNYIRRWNEKNNDSLSTEITRDSSFIFKLDTANLFVVFSQYHSVDQRRKFGIVSIENIKTESLPTYLFSDVNADKYLADSVLVKNRKILIFGRILHLEKSKTFKLSFDLNFNGEKFSWTTE